MFEEKFNSEYDTFIILLINSFLQRGNVDSKWRLSSFTFTASPPSSSTSECTVFFVIVIFVYVEKASYDQCWKRFIVSRLRDTCLYMDHISCIIIFVTTVMCQSDMTYMLLCGRYHTCMRTAYRVTFFQRTVTVYSQLMFVFYFLSFIFYVLCNNPITILLFSWKNQLLYVYIANIYFFPVYTKRRNKR